MLFYTRSRHVAKGKITVNGTDAKSMKLERLLLFESAPEIFISTSKDWHCCRVVLTLVNGSFYCSIIPFIIRINGRRACIVLSDCKKSGSLKW